jgi:hypothetical protein
MSLTEVAGRLVVSSAVCLMASADGRKIMGGIGTVKLTLP